MSANILGSKRTRKQFSVSSCVIIMKKQINSFEDESSFIVLSTESNLNGVRSFMYP